MKILKKDTFYWVIPVFAVVVIFQAVILVRNSLNTPTAIASKVATSTASNVVKSTMKEDLDLSIVSLEKEWKVGKTYKVSVNVLANAKKQIDAMDLFIKYDLSAFKVAKMVQGEGLPKPVTNKIGDKKGLVVANLYIPGTESYNINKAESKVLLTFEATPTKVGAYKFEFDTGKVTKDSVTMIVEAKTANVIPFSAGMLTINVVK